MERVTISLDDDLLAQFDDYLKRKGYVNRSEGVRDLLRERLGSDRLAEDKAKYAIAALSYIYNHEQRELARRLAKRHHAHLDLVLSTLHVHLDHENCLEVSVLRGRTRDVRTFAEATIAETGVRHGNLHLVPSEMATAAHDRHGRDHPHPHLHPGNRENRDVALPDFGLRSAFPEPRRKKAF